MREFSKNIKNSVVGFAYKPNNNCNSNEKPFEDDNNLLKGFVYTL